MTDPILTIEDLHVRFDTYAGTVHAVNGFIGLNPQDAAELGLGDGARATVGAIIELAKPLSDHKPVWAEITFPRNHSWIALTLRTFPR